MASKLRVDEINSNNGNVSIGTATFTGGLSGDITGLNVTGVITATTLNQSVAGTGSSITVGDTVINSNSIGVGATTTTGRNAGVSTAAGTLIYNSDTGSVQVYNGNAWGDVGSEATQATGGQITEYAEGGKIYRAHIFTKSASLDVISAPPTATVDYLVVAGGGGGGAAAGGGGGAGGFRSGNGISISASTGAYAITVGGGGGAGRGLSLIHI